MTPTVNTTAPVRRADSQASETKIAIAEIDSELKLSNAALSVLFFSSTYDRETLTAELNSRSEGATVIGCTTAGEIGLKGYQNNSISGFSLSKDEFTVSTVTLTNLKDLSVEQAREAATSLMKDMRSQSIEPSAKNCFALLLVDGLSVSEEPLTYKLQEALNEIPLIGGSAGDALEFKDTFVFSKNACSTDTAVIALIYTTRPFEIIKEQTIHPTDTRVVITEADPKNRIIKEINGEPAAEEYADLLDLDGPEDLNMDILSNNPLMLQLGDSWYIRSPHTVNKDNSLSLFCAVEEGLVLAIGKHSDLTTSLRETLTKSREKLGDMKLLIACDCIQRRLKLEATKKMADTSEVMSEFNAIGFSTYGEQYGTVHVNQTLAAIAIG